MNSIPSVKRAVAGASGVHIGEQLSVRESDEFKALLKSAEVRYHLLPCSP